MSAFLALMSSIVLVFTVMVFTKTPEVRHARSTNAALRSNRRDLNVPMPISVDRNEIPSPPYSPPDSSESAESINSPYIVPAHVNKHSVLKSNASRGEKMCAEICKDVFPGALTYYNYRDPTFSNPDTGYALEFDIFMPELRIAVEYNGQQHYSQTGFGDPRRQQARDQIKAALAHDYHIVLVTIPYTYSESDIRRSLNAISVGRYT